MKKRLVILISSLLLIIVLVGTLASPALAGKATARGKIKPVTYDTGIQEPTSDTTRANGQYVFYANVDVDGDIDTFTLEISLRKLEPRAWYVIGYIIRQPYAGDVYYEAYRPSNNRGTLSYTIQAEGIFYSDEEFVAYVDTDLNHEDLLLSSDPVTLFPTEPTTPI